MNKKALGGLGLLALGAVCAIMGKRESMNRLDPKTPEPSPEPDTQDIRRIIVNVANTQIGPQDPKKYWLDVVPDHPDFHGAWCGGFTLWVLHQAGLARDINWEIGKGYCYRLPTTDSPQPGDIAYFDQPYQHHAIVEAVVGNQVYTIDGNQPGNTVARRLRPRDAVTAFYSIAPLISASLQV